MKEHDVVRLLVNRPDCGVKAGDEGAIIHIYEQPDYAYLVEFVDQNGRERASCVLQPAEVELVWEMPNMRSKNL